MANSKNIKTYLIFHLNMSFSSIEEHDRPSVLSRCYWPLLRLIEQGYPLAIEATGLTLEHVHEVDPEWISTLRGFIEARRCEFIGSGYTQLIGPLVPHQVNAHNLRLGNAVYADLLGTMPEIALVNEQAYSPSLVDLYLGAGFKAIVMDWANPHSQHRKEWPSTWRYYPQQALSARGHPMPLIWVDSIPFQQFQRYVHGESDIKDMFEYITVEDSGEVMAFPLYGNDAEIFDYRPGRFETEPDMGGESEWERIGALFEAMKAHGSFELVHPSDVLKIMQPGMSGHILRLESSDDPIPVKKQPKYNVIRWAVTGRDDLWANTACWRIFQRLEKEPAATDEQWRTMCRLWSSDYRTHITETRWRSYLDELSDAGAFGERRALFRRDEQASRVRGKETGRSPFHVESDHRYISIQAPCGRLKLRLMRGLAIEGFWPNGEEQSLVRTLPHGYFYDINWGADFYSGHLIAQIIGRPQVTDLEKVSPEIYYDEHERFIDIEADIDTLAGNVFKRVRFFADRPRIEISYRLDWLDGKQGSVRFGNVTLNPAGFERGTLYYATHNGGPDWERHSLAEVDVDHARPPSFLVSARAGLGVTEGKIIVGDMRRRVLLECPREIAAMPGLVTCKTVDDRFFCRIAFSAREIDDTAKPGPYLPIPGRREYMIAITALEGGGDELKGDLRLS